MKSLKPCVLLQPNDRMRKYWQTTRKILFIHSVGTNAWMTVLDVPEG